jgi:hypothetical protein
MPPPWVGRKSHAIDGRPAQLRLPSALGAVRFNQPCLRISDLTW